MKKLLFLVLFPALLLASCSLQKRHYRPGFYHDGRNHVQVEKTVDEESPVKVNDAAAQPAPVSSQEDSAAAQEPRRTTMLAASLPAKWQKPVAKVEKLVAKTPVYTALEKKLPARAAGDDTKTSNYTTGTLVAALLALIGLLLVWSFLHGGSWSNVTFGGVLLAIFSPVLALIALICGIFAVYYSFAEGADMKHKRNAFLVLLLALGTAFLFVLFFIS